MKLLAIDTSTEIASVALLYEKQIFQKEQENQKTHAQKILPLIDELMRESGVLLSQLDGIIFGVGPGSFTGLRVTCSIAKGLAYAHDLSLIPVSSLAAIAWTAGQQNPASHSPVLAVLDARMHEMYWACYTDGQFIVEEKVSPVAKIEVPGNSSIILAGVGIEDYWVDFSKEIKEKIENKITLYPHAAAMIELAQFTSIQPVSVTQAQPVYIRNQVTYNNPPN